MQVPWRVAVALLAAILVLLAGCGGARPGDAVQQPAAAAHGGGAAEGGTDPGGLEVKPLPGYLAADFRATDVFSGEVVSLADLKGQPVFLNFWATWCPPCKDEMPDMEDFHKEMGDQVRVVAIGADSYESPEKMAAFAEALGLNFAVVHDGGNAARAYRVSGVPTSFFIDGDGVIRVRHTGQLSLEQMKEYAEQASKTADE